MQMKPLKIAGFSSRKFILVHDECHYPIVIYVANKFPYFDLLNHKTGGNRKTAFLTKR